MNITGEPPPKVTWTFADKPLGSDIDIKNQDYKSVFAIASAKRKMGGVYKITAVNASGSDTADLELTVIGK